MEQAGEWRAAGKRVEKKSEYIAESRLKKIIGGDYGSTELLFALAEGQIDCEDEAVMRLLCRFAEKLAAEPEWQEPPEEAAEERGIGEG